MKIIATTAFEAGATAVGYAKVADMKFDPAFRAACEQNVCGKFGKCWMCPPDAGDINEMIATAKKFENIMVLQTIGQLEDSYDFEGMQEAAVLHNKMTFVAAEKVRELYGDRALVMGAGACHVCARCTRLDEQPCRNPDTAIPSLEVYGVAVSELAAVSGLKYINGENTVTYFSGVLYNG